MEKETIDLKRKYHFESDNRMVYDETLKEFIARINNAVQSSENIIVSLSVQISGKESDYATLKVTKMKKLSTNLFLIQCYKKKTEDSNDVNKSLESYPSYLTSYNYELGGEGFGIQSGTRDALKFVHKEDTEIWIKKAEETFTNYEFDILEIERKFFGRDVLIPYLVLSNDFHKCARCKLPIFADEDYYQEDERYFHKKCHDEPMPKLPICPFCKKPVDELNGDDPDIDDLGRTCHHVCFEEYMEKVTEEGC